MRGVGYTGARVDKHLHGLGGCTAEVHLGRECYLIADRVDVRIQGIQNAS